MPKNTSFFDKLIYEIKDWALWIGVAIIVATIIGNVLAIFLGNQTPLVAVMSGSMVHDPASIPKHYAWLEAKGFSQGQINAFPFPNGFNKGDVLIIFGAEDPTIGEVIVFHVPNSNYPIIHRIVEKQESGNITLYRTKGDHNPGLDPWLTPETAIEGKAVLKVPIVGFIKVIPIEMWNSIVRR